jgi:hypothetical protein
VEKFLTTLSTFKEFSQVAIEDGRSTQLWFDWWDDKKHANGYPEVLGCSQYFSQKAYKHMVGCEPVHPVYN